MIVDVSYFQGDFNIAQLGQLAVQEKVNTYIDKYEPEYLKNVLGYKLYKAFLEGIAEPEPESKWLALRDGAEYTDRNGYLAEWKGLTAKPTSPIAAYVYFQYVNSEARFLSGSGPVVSKTENSTRAVPANFQVPVWNAMIEQNRALAGFISDSSPDYDEYGPYHFYGYYRYNWEGWRFDCNTPDHRLNLFTTVNTFGI